jgi:hypothetical protein
VHSCLRARQPTDSSSCFADGLSWSPSLHRDDRAKVALRARHRTRRSSALSSCCCFADWQHLLGKLVRARTRFRDEYTASSRARNHARCRQVNSVHVAPGTPRATTVVLLASTHRYACGQQFPKCVSTVDVALLHLMPRTMGGPSVDRRRCFAGSAGSTRACSRNAVVSCHAATA